MPPRTLRNLITPVERPETPLPGKTYRQIGVQLWGRGAYERELLDGGGTKYKKLSRVELNDIIVNKIWARNGSVAVVPSTLAGCYVSGEFPTFVADQEKLDPRWFHWYTKTPALWDQCDEKSRGTSGKNRIRPEKFLEITIPLPSLNEQRLVMSRIEDLVAKVEEARGLRRQTLAKSDKLLSSRRAQVFEERLANGTMRLDAAATLERGKFSYRPRNDPRFFGGKHPWIQIGEIEASDKFIREWTETLNDDSLAISRKFLKGTVLVSIAATIGAVGILNFDCCIPDSIVALTPKPEIDSEFLYHYLAYVRGHLENIAPESSQKNINLRILAGLPFPITRLDDQRSIVTLLDGLKAKVDSLKEFQSETAEELDALMPSVLSRAFCGEL